MKKKKNNIFSKIANFFDRLVIVPITKLVTLIIKKIDNPGKWLEKWLSKSNTLLFISLFLAILSFIIVDQKIVNFSDSSAEVLKNQTLTAVYNEESYVVEGLPETVDITIIGCKADLYIAKLAPVRQVTVDLSSLKPVQHKVELDYDQANDSVEYIVNPSVITVYIYQKQSITKTVDVDLLNQDGLDDKLVIDDVNYDVDKVVVKGADYQLAKVATVKALVDVSSLSKKEVGTQTVTDVPLKAYDVDGNPVDVEIVPSKINVDITISSPSKTVPIKIIPKGNVAFGKAISSIEQNVKEVTIYGTNEALDKLEYVPVEISVDGITDKTEFKAEIDKPSGVKSISSNYVTITVHLGTVAEREIEGIKIDSINLGSGYSVQAVDTNSVTVVVKGVSDVIEGLTSKDISAYIDLQGLGEGTHNVDIKVEGTDVKVQYSVKIKNIDIKIFKS